MFAYNSIYRDSLLHYFFPHFTFTCFFVLDLQIRKTPAPSSVVGEPVSGKRVSTRRNVDGDMVDIDDAMIDENYTSAASGPRTRGARNAAIAAAAAMDNEYSDSSVSVPVRGSRSASSGVANAIVTDRGMDAQGTRGQISTRRRGNAATVSASTAGRMAASHANMTMAQDMPTASNAADDDQEVYCICQDKAHGEMIGCDNKGCKIEWFHMACVGLDSNSRHVANWFCPDCTQAMREQEAIKKAAQGRSGSNVPMSGPGMEMEGGKGGAYAGVKRQGMPPEASPQTQGVSGNIKKPMPMGKPSMVGNQPRGGTAYSQVDGHGYVPATIPAGHAMPGRLPAPAPPQQVHLPPHHPQPQQQPQQQQAPQQMTMHSAHVAQPMPGYQGHMNVGYVMPGMSMRGDQFHPQGDMNVAGHPGMTVPMQMMRDGQPGQAMVSMAMVHPMSAQGQAMPDMYATGNPTQQTGHSTQGYNATA